MGLILCGGVSADLLSSDPLLAGSRGRVSLSFGSSWNSRLSLASLESCHRLEESCDLCRLYLSVCLATQLTTVCAVFTKSSLQHVKYFYFRLPTFTSTNVEGATLLTFVHRVPGYLQCS